MNAKPLLLTAGLAAALLLSACDRAEDPAKTRADVAKAQAEANQKSQDARAEANKDIAAAQSDLAKVQADANKDMMRPSGPPANSVPMPMPS